MNKKISSLYLEAVTGLAIQTEASAQSTQDSIRSVSETAQQRENSKKKACLQKFNKEWLTTDGLKFFEQYENDSHHVWCELCRDIICVAKAGKSELVSHIGSENHRKAMSKTALAAFLNIDGPVATKSDESSEAFDDSKVTLNSLETTVEVNGKIYEIDRAKLIQILKRSNFSLIIQHSADKFVVMTVRILEDDGDDLYRVRDFSYRALLFINQTLYDIIVYQFECDGIDYKQRLVGFGYDGESAQPEYAECTTRLMEDCPNLIVIKTTYHSLNFCVSNACKHLPEYLEQLVEDIFSYFPDCKPKELEELQNIMGVKSQKAMYPSALRWLSMEIVVKRMSKRFDELETFFTSQFHHLSTQNTRGIFHPLRKQITKPLIYFMDYVLRLINKTNQMLQNESPDFPNRVNAIKSLLTILVSSVCDEHYLESSKDFLFSDFEQHLRKKSEINVGPKVERLLKYGALDGPEKEAFYTICSNFYVELILQITKRFVVNNIVLNTAAMVDPRFAKLEEFNWTLEEFSHFYDDGEVLLIKDEFHDLRTLVIGKKIHLRESDDWETCWRKLLRSRKEDGKLAFPLLRKFISKVLVIPCSSAAVERIFSMYDVEKTLHEITYEDPYNPPTFDSDICERMNDLHVEDDGST